jgi:hypothetical protein
MPTDPMNDRRFIGLVSQVYDIGGPTNVPPDALESAGRLISEKWSIREQEESRTWQENVRAGSRS